MTFWDWVFAPFLAGTPGDPDGSAARAFLGEMEELLTACGVAKTPLVALRVVEVLSATLTGRALEEPLYAEGIVQGPLSAEKAQTRPSLHPFLEASAKVLDRRRKALTELEDACTRTGGAPMEIGLADEMKPILKKAEGVLEEVLAYKPRKRKSNV